MGYPVIGSESVNPTMLTMLNTRASLGNAVKTSGTATPISLVGTADVSLPPPSNPQPLTGGVYNGYKRIDGLGLLSQRGSISVVGSEFVIGAGGAGDYRTPHAWIGSAVSVDSTVTGFVFATEKASDGLLYFSQRVVAAESVKNGRRNNISGGGFIESLTAGDKISVWAASSASCDLTVFDANLGLEMALPESFKV
jgi:hypothetical protein